ncbi:coenzyme A transporter [Sporobolomyces salmoneus]|uniref:coenzyme A transporter n=1 Tax=Sporobolomyces salmoneus TaxID=183962 RepID=UPI00317361F3
MSTAAASPPPPRIEKLSSETSTRSFGEPVQTSPHSTSKKRRTRPQHDSLSYALTSGLAGGIAGCIAKTSVAPLDRVKILFQTRSPDYARYAGTWFGVFRASRDIYQETGVRGLLQGHSATLLRIFPYAAIKFMAYEQFHSFLMPTPESEDSIKRFVAGSLAGITTTAITYPLELIRVRLAFEPHHSKNDQASLLRTIRAIYLSPPPPEPVSPSPPSSTTTQTTSTTSSNRHLSPRTKPPNIGYTSLSSPRPSLTHFYRGVFPTLAGIIPYAGTSFLVWGYLKNDLFPSLFPSSSSSSSGSRPSKTQQALLDLLAGGIAGAIGQTTAYPLDIVRRRMQVGPVMDHHHPSTTITGGGGKAGFWETGSKIWKTQGWRGFFVGLSIGYLKVVPMNAVSFSSWVFMKRVLGLDEEGEGDGRD